MMMFQYFGNIARVGFEDSWHSNKLGWVKESPMKVGVLCIKPFGSKEDI